MFVGYDTLKIYCCNCNKDVDAQLVDGSIVYPYRSDLYKLKFYRCPFCHNFVGTHKDTEKPLGCIASSELKTWRIKVHNRLDYLWKKNICKRKEVYKQLSEHFGYDYHNGNTKSIEECQQALEVIEKIYKNTD